MFDLHRLLLHLVCVRLPFVSLSIVIKKPNSVAFWHLKAFFISFIVDHRKGCWLLRSHSSVFVRLLRFILLPRNVEVYRLGVILGEMRE